LTFNLVHALRIVLLTGGDIAAVYAIDVVERACANPTCYALTTNEVVLGKTVLVDAYYRSRVQSKIVRLVEGNSLRCAVDVHALHRAVALYDSLATGIIGVAARLAVVRLLYFRVWFNHWKCHQRLQR